MATKKSSDVWNFFQKSKTDKSIVTCKICSSNLKYINSSTTGMRKHLSTKHECEYLGIPAPSPVLNQSTSSTNKAVMMTQPTLAATVERTRVYGKTSERKIHLDNLLMSMIAKDMQTLSIVDDKGFQAFTKALDCKYELPSRRTLTRDILPKMYGQYKTEAMEHLAAASHVACTTDIWTARTTEGYITLTAHFVTDDFEMRSFVLSTVRMVNDHTAVNVAEQLKELFSEWNIQDKVQAVVTDNASNMIAAVTQELKLRSVRCFAHSLNLVVQESIKTTEEVNNVRKKVKNIVTYFHHSVKGNDRLRETQKKHGNGAPKKLIQDVDTRWNSTASMLRRYSEHHEAVTTTLCLLGKSDMCIADQDVAIIKKSLDALEPFQMVTEEMSSEVKVTLSKMIPFVRLLHKSLNSIADTSLVQQLHFQLRKRFSDLQSSFVASAATYLDPRFKSIHFSDRDALARTQDRLKEMLVRAYAKERTAHVQVVEATEAISEVISSNEPPTKKRSIWDEHDEQISDMLKKAPTQISGPEMEMRRYAESTVLQRNEDPLHWWNTNRHLMPHLSQIAKQFFGIPATSVPAERLFSKAGELLSARRSTLKDSHVDKLLFLNKNVKF